MIHEAMVLLLCRREVPGKCQEAANLCFENALMREREREREPLLENALMRLRASLRLRLSALHAARAAPRLSGDLFGRKRGPVH